MADLPHAGLLERFRAEPGRARVALSVTTSLAEGMRCETVSRGHGVVVDEPASFGGTDTAQSPVELLLSSLATCQAITYRLWAAQLGVALERVEVEVTGHIDLRGYVGLDGDAAPGYERLEMRVALEGPDDPARYAELRDAVERHCPVLDVLTRPVPVECEVELPGG